MSEIGTVSNFSYIWVFYDHMLMHAEQYSPHAAIKFLRSNNQEYYLIPHDEFGSSDKRLPFSCDDTTSLRRMHANIYSGYRSIAERSPVVFARVALCRLCRATKLCE